MCEQDNSTRDDVEEKRREDTEDAPPPIPSLPVSPRTLIANAYYDKLLADTDIQQVSL